MNRISGLIATNKSKGNSTSAVDIMKIEVKGRISSFYVQLRNHYVIRYMTNSK